MRDRPGRRLFFAVFFAVLAGMFVAYANPADRIKADLRADAKGFALSLEYVVRVIDG